MGIVIDSQRIVKASPTATTPEPELFVVVTQTLPPNLHEK